MRTNQGIPKRRLLIYSFIIIYYVTIIVIDRVFWPDNNLPIFFAAPIMGVALLEPPWSVGIVVAIALLLNLSELFIKSDFAHPWVFTTAALIVIGSLALHISSQRQRMEEREQRRQAMIKIVEELRQPLTVLIGNLQRLQRAGGLTCAAQGSLQIVERSAHDLERLVTKLLNFK